MAETQIGLPSIPDERTLACVARDEGGRGTQHGPALFPLARVLRRELEAGRDGASQAAAVLAYLDARAAAR